MAPEKLRLEDEIIATCDKTVALADKIVYPHQKQLFVQHLHAIHDYAVAVKKRETMATSAAANIEARLVAIEALMAELKHMPPQSKEETHAVNTHQQAPNFKLPLCFRPKSSHTGSS